MCTGDQFWSWSGISTKYFTAGPGLGRRTTRLGISSVRCSDHSPSRRAVHLVPVALSQLVVRPIGYSEFTIQAPVDLPVEFSESA